MPDIDIDFSVRGRERVIRYVTEKYGKRVGRPDRHLRQDVPARGDARRRARARPRLRDRRPAGEADPRADQGRPPSFEDCLKPGPAAARRGRPRPDRQADRRGRAGARGDRPQLLDPRRRGRDRRPPADRHRPAPDRRRRRRRAARSVFRTVTQFTMKPIEQIGLLKMDFLGLRNLDVIEDALDIIERSTGERPDMATLPLDDAQDVRDDGRAATRSACSSSSPRACARRSRRSADRVRAT